MTGWQWFWTVVGFILFIVLLIFLYYSAPFEQLFVPRASTASASATSSSGWRSIVGIIGFCAYPLARLPTCYIASRRHSVDAMVLSSLRGSTFTAILLSGRGDACSPSRSSASTCSSEGYMVDAEFGKRLGALVALVVLTAIFCVIFWLLKVIRPEPETA